MSKSGFSVSQRVGPLTLNSRGRGSLRLAPGLSFRFGKNTGGAAVVVLVAALVVFALELAVALLRVAVAVLVWLARWGWFAAAASIHRWQHRRFAQAADVPTVPPAAD